MSRRAHKKNTRRRLLWLPVIYVGTAHIIAAVFPAPVAVSKVMPARIAENVTFLADISWVDAAGQRHLQQQIFDAAVNMIEQATAGIVLDMFLFNAWQGPVREEHRALSDELTNALITRKQARPAMPVLVISDPVNEVYGGIKSVHFDALRAAGVRVVLTDLVELQDSNLLYSGIWRWLIRPFGNSAGDALPNPFGTGRVSVRSYLALMNFKANHRKLLIVDKGSANQPELAALVTSANPHDGSSAHRNVALHFDGDAVIDLLRSEAALLHMSDQQAVIETWPASWRAQMNAQQHMPVTQSDANLKIVSESRIERSVIDLLDAADASTQIDLLMFYLADRTIINALKRAGDNGATIRVLLDVNNDAFGRQKNGVPNKPVAAELVEHGIDVRWCETRGEQCHAKMLMVTTPEQHALLLGSGNYTRRNMDDYNLETDVLMLSTSRSAAMQQAQTYFDRQWNNEDGKQFSSAYSSYANESWLLQWQYRFMEFTGISTF